MYIGFPISLMTNKHMENEKEILNMINQLDKQDFELSSDIKLLFDEIKNIEGKNDISKVESEINSLKESIGSISLQKGDKGDDGKDYILTDSDKEEISELVVVPVVEKVIEKVETIKELPIITNEIKEVAKYENAEQIVEKINTLENVIDIKTIKDFPKIEGNADIKRQVDTIGNQVLRLMSKQTQSVDLSGYVPTTRTLTINGVTEDLSADRTWSVGTVTSVAALTLGTTGTDISSSVATGTTTPVITLNVPTASASNRGALSSTDWTTFNSKFTLPSLTNGSVLFSNGTTIAQDNANFFWDDTNNRLGIGTNAPSAKLEVRGISDFWGLQVGNGTVGALFQVYGGKAGFVGFNGSAYNSLDIRSGISTQLFLATNGNAGIGTTSPSSPLHVSSSTNSITGRFTGNGISNRVIIEGTGAGISAISFAETNIGSRWGIGSVLSTQAFVISKSGDLGGAGNLALEIGQSTRNMGIQLSGATAKIHIAAGSATAGTAPLKFTSGTNLTTAEAGAMEYDGTSLYFSPSTTRRTVVLDTATQTLTNKRINPRVQAVTSASTVTPSADNDDEVVITAQGAALTLANWSGTPVQGQAIIIRIKDDSTARAITFDTLYRAVGAYLPTTTVIGKTVYIACIYNSTDTKIDVVSVAQEI